MFRHEFDAVARAHMGEKAAGNPGIADADYRSLPASVKAPRDSLHAVHDRTAPERRWSVRFRAAGTNTGYHGKQKMGCATNVSTGPKLDQRAKRLALPRDRDESRRLPTEKAAHPRTIDCRRQKSYEPPTFVSHETNARRASRSRIRQLFRRDGG